MALSKDAVLAAAKDFIAFINRSPSPFHAVDECRIKLLAAGFQELKESDHWNVNPQDKCFVVRNQSTLVAFAIGGQYRPGNGFSIVGAHTDSPCLKVKPISRRVKNQFIQVAVECYGGGTWHTWTDRDLKLAGRVLVREQDKIRHRLIDINRPILRVPNIAIHLHRDLGSKFEFNKETHLVPVLATTVAEKLNGQDCPMEGQEFVKQHEKHHPVLISLLCQELSVQPEQIMDFELCLSDFAPAVVGGAFEEFIFAPRLDNLHSSYCALQGLVKSLDGDTLSQEVTVRMISLFDNEEVGSDSAQGAGSSLQENILRRLCTGGHTTAFEEAMPKSLLISADMAHALHPNYSEKHEDQHRPELHKGIVVKFNCNQRYATTSITAAMVREAARMAGVPLQDFVVRNDSPCGSTIGPIMSTKLGIPTVDVGAPQLSMHSIREMCDVSSIDQATRLFKSFFENYYMIRSSMENI